MIKEYTTKDGTKKYLFQVYLGVDPLTGKKRKTTRRGFNTRKEANLAQSRLKLEIEENGLSSVQNRMKFEEVLDMWKEAYKPTVKPSTYRTQMREIKNHVLPFFEGKYVDSVSLPYCQKFINNLANTLVRYNNPVNLANRVFQYALSLGVIRSNPFANTLRPRKKDSKLGQTEFWTKEQLQKFLSIIKSEQYELNVHPLFRLLAYTGMRKSEAMALRWSDIDFDNSNLTVNRSLAYTNDGYQFQTPKTKSSLRTIAIDATTLRILKQLNIAQKRYLLNYGLRSKGNEQLVFISENNTNLHADYANYFLDKIIKEHNLTHITVHGLRHTHCSLLFEAGASIKEVQVRLGHKDIKTTLNIYTHVTEKAREETADKFADYLAI